MARTNMNATRVKPAESQLLTLRVLRRAPISPNFARVTLGGGDIARFVHLGFDQWFRLFIPVADGGLERLPNKLDTLSYLRYLTIAKTERPVLRNYTVRAYRAEGEEGPELDIDFVLHGSPADGTSGPAATWAQTCEEGDAVALLDEGVAYQPPPGRPSLLVADETALPAAAGILSSLPRDATGRAFLEIPHPDDAQELDAPDGVEVTWVPRADPHAVPGRTVLAVASAEPVDGASVAAWVAGEQSLATGLRRHWVQAGVPKTAVSFTGYWRASH